MSSPTDRKATRARVSAHRLRLRRQGLRPIQIWVPDTRRKGFSAEAARQARAIAESPLAHEDQAFIDAVTAEPEA
ncbi:MAG: antitoxin MazE family protein [Rhizobiales bacterium]|nr:antitoxin MazE family protein [Hyphomicrobiales bacterium]